MKTDDVILEARRLTVFGKGVEKLHLVSLDFTRGEIHAIIGDHNSGKSLLAEVLSGAMRFQGGELLYEGQALRLYSPAKARRLGIQTVHQNPHVFNYFSVMENILFKSAVPPFSRQEMADIAGKVQNKLRMFGVDVDLWTALGHCSENEILVVYLVRGLCVPCRVLVVDGIASRLSPAQVDIFQNELSLLRQRGVTVIYCTGNVEEAYHFANRISFLQDGRLLATEVASDLGKLELAQLSYSHLYSRKELERNNFELFYLKSYYENIINNMPIPLLLLNSQRIIIHMNNRFSERYRVRRHEYLGKNVACIFRAGTHEHEYFSSAMTFEPSAEAPHAIETVLAIGDGARTENLQEIPVYDEDNSLLGSMLFFSAARTDDYTSQLAKKVETEKRVPFFAHEIRNPLAILSNLLALIREKNSSKEIRDYVERSESEVKRISGIVRKLMQEQRASSESSRPSGTNLWLLAEEIRFLFMPMLGEKSITIQNETAKDLFLLYDEDELKEVLINLVLNAIEAIRISGVVTIGSDVEELNRKPYTIIHIRDNGVGIAAENLEKVFQPFFSTKTGKEPHGLGLAICKDVVDSWGGMITVDSKAEIGSTFSIFLPA